ncbi:SDR family NAD(P)-dependent oxidoreductase [Roseiconus nitratireducens]|uniref:SDR family NAD(P)-dependent oxidoreductase n=1 Tax=Roseiconus nitratireducens TaxID=2605748 RepID=A0A5M6CUV3_9BACT|nr:SDR family NAD(P)-dependent oxidoreductase [Roseiconus nitratireducens]KAA5539028.1 SDR family NAD(P)-dependent oxidoreductase [Roseiconus nitratireducens]
MRPVLITGSSSGIGRACALDLDRAGFSVFAGVRRPSDADALRAEASPNLKPVILDVTDAESVRQAADFIGDSVGPAGLCGVVNNAGISVACVLEYLPLEQLRRQFEVNVFGVLTVTQSMLPLLRSARGRVVNISSLSGLTAGPYVGPYAASKHALEAISDSLRLELRGFGIDVAVIEPADIDTPIWEKSQRMADTLRDEVLESIGDRIPQEVQDVYRNDIVSMRQATERFAASAIPVHRVVRAVNHALTSRRPKTRYRVGAKTWGVAHVLRRLPDRLRDHVVLRSLGMR